MQPHLSLPATMLPAEPVLSTTQAAEFYERAQLLGHDVPLLKLGEEHCTYFTIPTAEEARRLLSNATPAQAQQRYASFFQPAIAVRQRLGQGMHDRGEAMVFAGGPLPPTDSRGLANHLPLHAKAISVAHKVVGPGETWDVSVLGEVWGLDEMEELYTTVNVGVLVLHPGARLVVRGNVFSLLCQRLIQLPGPEPAAEDEYQIGILPTPFSVDFGHGPLHGVPGQTGQSGAAGRPGQAVPVSRNLLGFQLHDAFDASAVHGGRGADGLPGEPGGHGRNGGMCKLAELTVRHLTGSLTVFAQAGRGGDGAAGGDGGHGGAGGAGQPGYRFVSGSIAPGRGGDGGHGAAGGKGGNGGSGGLASNIYLVVPPADEARVTIISRPSEAGLAGPGGAAGIGGAAGPGALDNPLGLSTAGEAGLAGHDNEPGKAGAPGRGRPAAPVFLNEQLHTH